MIVEKEDSQVRLDQYLAQKLEISRSKIQNAIKEQKVKVNGKIVSASYQVKENDKIEMEEIEGVPITLEKENIPLDIVYEDDDLLIVNKQSGMVVHPAPGNYHKTLVNALLYHFSLSKEDSLRPGIVHRIDKDTSGLMVVAKNDETHEKLSEMIKRKEVERIYIALVDGIIPHETGTIDAPIGRDVDNRLKMKVTDINSKEAITHFKVRKRFPKHNQTLIECKLETGRTHQIRVHMAYIGYPIYNDPIYGKRKNTSDFGQFLHSQRISFLHPRTKKKIQFEAPLPKEFEDYLEQLEDL